MSRYCETCERTCCGACWGIPSDTEAAQAIALPHCDHTRCPAPPTPEPNGTGLPVALLALGVIFLAVAACAVAIGWSFS